MQKMTYAFTGCVLALFGASGLTGCGKGDATPAVQNDQTPPTEIANGGVTPVTTETTSPRRQSMVPKQDTQVHIKTNLGDIVLRLYHDRAPRTVDNFLDYVRDGFYDGTVVHHAEAGLVIAGGCDASLEFKATRFPILNESNNGLSNRRGTVAMARLPESAHSATSQFFINVKDNPSFDYQGEGDDRCGYCVFGEVVSGMEILDQIAQSTTGEQGNFSSVPQPQVVIQAIEDVAYLASQQDGTPLLR